MEGMIYDIMVRGCRIEMTCMRTFQIAAIHSEGGERIVETWIRPDEFPKALGNLHKNVIAQFAGPPCYTKE
jgi:hypothetical protein